MPTKHISIITLREFPVFSEFTESELQEMMPYIFEKEIPQGATLIKEDDIISEFYFLLEGDIELFQASQKKALQLSLAHLRSGDLIGEMSYFDGGKCSATAIAREPLNLGVLTYAKIQELARKNPALYQKLIEKLIFFTCARIRNTNKKLLISMENELALKDKEIAKANLVAYILTGALILILGINFIFYLKHKLGF